jgi:hypothetical protein
MHGCLQVLQQEIAGLLPGIDAVERRQRRRHLLAERLQAVSAQVVVQVQ